MGKLRKAEVGLVQGETTRKAWLIISIGYNEEKPRFWLFQQSLPICAIPEKWRILAINLEETPVLIFFA
jgi:hypothetical protein